MDRIKLLVVDNSILFRELISRYIQQDDAIEIVGKAGDAYSARDMILQYEPDVMTLDLEMPRMDGIAFLKKLLPQYYISTIVVSGSDYHKKECFEAGAVEFLSKPVARTNNDMAAFAKQLCAAIHKAYDQSKPAAAKPAAYTSPASSKTAEAFQKVHETLNKPINVPNKAAETFQKVHDTLNKPIDFQHKTNETEQKQPNSPVLKQMSEVAAKAEKAVSEIAHGLKKTQFENTEPAAPAAKTTVVNHPKLSKSEALIALGASTGGTEALEQVIRTFPEDTPPVVIVQHMPAGFTKLYSERLNRTCKMEVKEAVDGERLRRGLIIIGAGEHQLRVCRDSRGLYVSSKPGEKVSGHCPSVDVMFSSVAEVAGKYAIGAILTGMGKDGAEGLLKMRKAGAFTIGQDKETSVVYGMPMEAYKIGAVEVQAPLYKIADIILNNLI
ncbi:MAG: chemotaxis-specific protein-glutamate methyltransferase CheB [Oscillospiraceae bacterium]|nr:chemotaxis-specific protein-glutamate methyltransferase CheB [Oscillospiraceae bacterium]